MDKRMKDLKKQYEDVQIPDELDFIVEKALNHNSKKRRKMNQWILGAAASVLLFTTSVNVSPSLAKDLAKMPGLASIIDVITFGQYELSDEKSELSVNVPQITGDTPDIEHLNAQYVEEGKELFEKYKEIVEQYDSSHYRLHSDYKVVTDTEQLLVIQKSIEETSASGNLQYEYANLDRETGTYISLPSLFVDDRYIERISNYLVEKMRADIIETNGEQMYWVTGTEYLEDEFVSFTTIDHDQSFFINEHNKLMISFNEGTVAPSYLGVIEIEIPTEVIADLIVSKKYIQ